MGPPRALRGAWAARPSSYPKWTWALILALDRLPWPLGEELLVMCFVAMALVKTGRLRRALGWASAHRSTRLGRWRLALALFACRGRLVARASFTGIRDVEMLRRLVSLRGAEHLDAAGRGVILLGFHLGPGSPHLALRIAGHQVTWIAGRRSAPEAWPPELRAIHENPRETGSHHQDKPSLLRALYHARRLLGKGENVFVTADGRAGATVMEVPVPGGREYIRQGWLFLREITGVSVLPVLAHLEGRRQVVTVHPPLPPRCPDPVRDLEICRERLTALVTDHVRQFPEQCYGLAFPRPRDQADALDV